MSGWPLRIMVYGAGEAIDGANQLAPQIQAQLTRLGQVCTNSYVAATAMLGASNAPTLRYVLDPLNRQPVDQLPNIDVGDPNELVNFAGWSSAICPAARSVLVLSGHGAAWQDGMVDQVLGAAATRSVTAVPPVPGAYHNPRRIFGAQVNQTTAITRAVLVDGQDRDYLSNAQLGSACEQIGAMLGGKIDVLVFDACLMSAWEVLQELGDSVRAVVGSIDELSAAGIDMGGPAGSLSAVQGAADAKAIASAIVGGFQPQAAFDSCVAVDIENANWSVATASFSAFCAALLPWLQASPSNVQATLDALSIAATSVVEYSGGGLADVQALADAIGNIPNLPADAAANGKAAASALAACVLGRSAGQDYQAALGISIFAPNSASVYASNRPDYVRLQFSMMTGWAAVLDTLFGIQSSQTRFVSPPTAPQASAGVAADAEFVVVLNGLSIDQPTIQRMEKAIRVAVLETLANLDLMGDVTTTPPAAAAAVRALGLGGLDGNVRGLVVFPNSIAASAPAKPATRTVAPAAAPVSVTSFGSGDSITFRVVLRGLNLDQATRTTIDALIRSAVLAEVARIDTGSDLRISAPASNLQVRSVLGDMPHLLGLWIQTPAPSA